MERFRQGASQRGTARPCGLSRKTVRRFIRNNRPPGPAAQTRPHLVSDRLILHHPGVPQVPFGTWESPHSEERISAVKDLASPRNSGEGPASYLMST